MLARSDGLDGFVLHDFACLPELLVGGVLGVHVEVGDIDVAGFGVATEKATAFGG